MVEDERHTLLVCGRYASERFEMWAAMGMEDSSRDGDDSMEAVQLVFGRGQLGQTAGQMATRHKEAKRLVLRVLRRRATAWPG